MKCYNGGMKKIIYLSLFASLVLGCKKSETPPAYQRADVSGMESSSRRAAPEFKLKSIKGDWVALSDFKGKVVLIDFWATWCPPCRTSMPAVARFYEKHRAKGVEVIGISLDESTDRVPSFIQKEGVKYTILYGADSEVASDYEVEAIPTFVLIDREGNVVESFSGYYPGMEKKWEENLTSLLSDTSGGQ